MVCTSPITIKVPVLGRADTQELQVPCGKCLACRIKKRQEWSMRCMHELDYWTGSSFLTLTYSDDYLPDNSSLSKRDLQLFIKRLRKNLGERRIKYFACGEYGDTSGRPHYHAIMYGVALTREDRDIVMSSWPYADWTQPTIRRKSFGLVEPDSIRYVCQYIDKKYTGELEEEVYKANGLETPFRLLSQGIGERYAEDNVKQIKELGYITVNGVKHSVPRYYIKKLELDTDDLTQQALYADCEQNERWTGVNISSDDAMASMNPELIQRIYEGRITLSRKQRQRNRSKTSLKVKSINLNMGSLLSPCGNLGKAAAD